MVGAGVALDVAVVQGRSPEHDEQPEGDRWDTTITANANGASDANGLPLDYIKGANFGNPTRTTDYPRPRPGMDGGRTYLVAFGVRF